MARLLPILHLPTPEELDEMIAKYPRVPSLQPPPVTASSLRGREDPEVGIPLNHARFWFGPDHLVERYAEIKNSNTTSFFQPRTSTREWLETSESNQRQLQSVTERLESFLFDQLLSGELVITGFSSHDALDAKPIRVTTERLRTLDLDFAKCEAVGGGITISGIRVFKATSFAERKIEYIPGKVSRARLVSWYKSWIADHTAKGTIPSRHDEWIIARKVCGDGVPRDAVRELRRTLAPPEWKKQGRPRANRA